MASALQGIRVVELGRMFSAPWVGQMLADQGADVIKIESSDGDLTRKAGGVAVRGPDGKPHEDFATFISVNRNKKSVVVDLRSPEGCAIVRDLALRSDILVENFKAGDLARKGLDYESLKQGNPGLIYLSLSGFGQSGPYSARPAMDGIIQAMSGYMNLTIDDGGTPHPSPMVIDDFAGGMYGFSGIMTALYHRDARGGGGQHIDLSLLDAGIAMMSFLLQGAILSNHSLPRNVGMTRFAPGGIYETADGLCQIAIGPDADFRRFAAAIDRPDMADDPRFVSRDTRNTQENKAAINAITRPVLRQQPLAHWLERFAAANVMFSPIYSFAQMMDDPHVRTRELFQTVPHAGGGEVPLIRNPLRMSATPTAPMVSPPLLAQHSASVLREVLGLSEDRIAELVASGVIGVRA